MRVYPNKKANQSFKVLLGVAILFFISFRLIQANEPAENYLSGKKFESIKEYPVFRSKESRKHTITFEESKYFWSHGDVEEDGTYSLDKHGNILAEQRVGEAHIVAHFDPDKNSINWDREEYVLPTADKQ